MVLQRDGKIVVAGNAFAGGRNQFMLARFTGKGSLDPAFAGGWVIAGPGDRNTLAGAVALQKDGKIVAAGWSSGTAGEEFAVMRFLPSGPLDVSFDGDGVAITDFNRSGNEDQAHAVAIQKGGKILAAGYSNDGPDADFALARYLPNGLLDPSFNGDGRLVTPLSTGDDVANALRIQKDGRILAAGTAEEPAGFDFVLARYLKDGRPDPAFGSGTGRVRTSFSIFDDEGVTALALQRDGRMVAAGYAESGSNRDLALARYRKNGALDTRFGPSSPIPGTVTTDIKSFDHAHAVALQKDGRILVTGYVGLADRALLVARYLGR
jgi:uncharacterized delta-60 repeat protein